MADEYAIQRLREANPITNPADLVEERIDAHLFLAAIKQRSVEMRTDLERTTIEQDSSGNLTDVEVFTTGEPERLRRTVLVVGAAFALTIVVAGFLVLLNRDSKSDVASDSVPTAAESAPAGSEETVFGVESSLAVVDRYFAAFNGGDVDSLQALFTEDATFSANISGTVGELRLVWTLAQGSTLTSPECAVVNEVVGSAVTISCEYGTLQAPALAVGAPAVATTTEMTITPDGISDLRDWYAGSHFTVVGNPFTRWLRENHPEDAGAAGCCQGGTVEESVDRAELRAQYATEWAAYLEANGCTYADLAC